MINQIHFVIIPGNPGIEDYYLNFKNELKDINKKSEVHVLPYEGFKKNPPPQLYSITEEKNFIKYKLENILTIYPDLKNTRWVLIGHSIGAWVVLQILMEWILNHKKLYSRIHGAFMLFPFLALDPESKDQSKLREFLNNSILKESVLFTYKLIRVLPIPYKIWDKFILSRSPLMDEETLLVNREYFFDFSHIPSSIIHLAKTEFDTLEQNIEFGKTIQQISKHPGKIQFFYTQKDIWAPLRHMEYLNFHLNGGKNYNLILQKKKKVIQNLLPKVQKPTQNLHPISQNLRTQQQPIQTPTPPFPIHYDPQFTHDFCVNRKQSRLMAERISQLVKNFH